MAAVQTMADPNGVITEVLAEMVELDGETALQVCVQVGDRRVIDVAAGVRDIDTGEPASVDSLFTVFSVTKGIVAAAALSVLADGLLRLDQPVAHYWPAFAAAGKGEVTVLDLLTHSAGIPQMPDAVSIEVMCDWEQMVSLVANLEPQWHPGSAAGYHAYTFGWTVGELLRRVLATDRSVGELVRERVCEPAGVEDFWIGIPLEVEPRVVTLYREEPWTARTGLSAATIPEPVDTVPEVYNRRDVRRAPLPAAGGITNARSLAAMYAMLADRGAAGGRQVIDEDWVARAGSVWRDDLDRVIGSRTARGLGYNVSSTVERLPPFAARRPALGHPGAGGSIAWADLDTGAGVAITRSRLTRAGWRGSEMQRLITALIAELSQL